MSKGLILTDIQNDFCEGGTLAVSGGAYVAAKIGKMDLSVYDYVVASKDYHIDPGPHFSTDPNYVDSWPKHCVADSAGSDFFWAVTPATNEAIVFHKGRFSAAYSAFEGRCALNEKTLEYCLNNNSVTSVDIVGIALDYCVKATALEAQRLGFDTRVLMDYTASVRPYSDAQTILDLRNAGVKVA